MTKGELIARLSARQPDLNRAECQRAVEPFFDIIAAHVSVGGRVELRQFGAFFVSALAERNVRNPNTGEWTVVRPNNVVRFRPCPHLNARLTASS